MIDYLDTYNYFYNKTNEYTELYLLLFFKNCFKQERAFNYVYNNSQERITTSKGYASKHLQENYPKSFYLFNNREGKYNRNILKNIFEIDLKLEFEKENKKSKLDTYTYKKFISNLAVIESLLDTSAIYQNSASLYEKMFTLGKFQKFKLVNYKNDPDLMELDNKLNKELYGKDLAADETDKSTLPDKTKNNEISTNSKKLEQLNKDIIFLDVEDKIILLNICFNHMKEIPISEFAKINYITKGLFDKDILLNKNTGSSTFYRKLNSGIGYYSGTIAKEKLSLLIYKIEALKTLNLISLLKILRKQLIMLK